MISGASFVALRGDKSSSRREPGGEADESVKHSILKYGRGQAHDPMKKMEAPYGQMKWTRTGRTRQRRADDKSGLCRATEGTSGGPAMMNTARRGRHIHLAPQQREVQHAGLAECTWEELTWEEGKRGL
jgi:hypothetical protein